MAHQYMPKILQEPHKNPPDPLLHTYVQSLNKNEEKIVKLEMFDLKYVLGERFSVLMVFKIYLLIYKHLIRY